MKTLLVLLMASGLAFSQAPSKVEYGKYLVLEMGKCQDCHTPRTEKGELDESKLLKGMVLDFQPIGTPPPGWHKTSPDLTPGSRLWSRWGEEKIVKFLVTGLGPSGKPADPPMPTYMLKQADAEAIVAYLKSLK